MDAGKKKKGKAVVVGGSIAGVSCAHALILAGWEVVVLEKTCATPTGSPTGAGLGLDPLAQKLIESWLGHPHLLHKSTFPLTIDQVLLFWFSKPPTLTVSLFLETISHHSNDLGGGHTFRLWVFNSKMVGNIINLY